MDEPDCSECHACGMISIARSSARYVPHPRGGEQARLRVASSAFLIPRLASAGRLTTQASP